MNFSKSIVTLTLCFAMLTNSLQAGHDEQKKGCPIACINKLTQSQWVYYIAGLTAVVAATYFAGHHDNWASNFIKGSISTGHDKLAENVPVCVAGTAAAGLFCKSTREAEKHGKKSH